MANTYTQLFIHIIFSTNNRDKCLKKEIRKRLFKYLSAIINQKGNMALAVGGYLDHVHLLVSIKPDISVSELVKSLKQSSTNFIKEKNLITHKFHWQKGYGAFTYSKSQIDDVIKYIMNQEDHHKHKTFEEEYAEFMDKFGVEYDKKYLFD